MKKLISNIILVLFLGLIMATIISSGVVAEEKRDSLVIGFFQEPPTLDPHMNISSIGRQLYCNIYDSLVKYDKDTGEYYPGLAESWTTSSDGTEYTYILRKGIKFHNGEKLKATDVKFSFDRGKKSPYTSNMYTNFKEAEVIDDYTVKVKLYRPSYIHSAIMSQPPTAIVNEKAVKELGKEYGRNPVGTGPYKFVRWDTGVKIDLVAYEDYFLGPANIKNLTYRIILDESTAMVALEKGEVDICFDLPPVNKDNIIRNPNLKYDEVTGQHIGLLHMNHENKYLSNRLVRQAINYAINREEVLAVEEKGVLAVNYIPEYMTTYFSDKVQPYPHDVEKAKELLKQAGYPDGFSIRYFASPGRYERLAQVFQSNLAEVGIKAKIEILEWGTYLDRVAKGEYDMGMSGFGIFVMDPQLLFERIFSSKNIGFPGNFARYNNPEVDKLLDATFVERDASKRRELFDEIQTIVHNDAVRVPLYWYVNTIAYNKDLEGVKALVIFDYNFINEYSWK